MYGLSLDLFGQPMMAHFERLTFMWENSANCCSLWIWVVFLGGLLK